MRSSIYVSSERIEVIGYSKSKNNVTIKQYVEFPLQEGTMINGNITDAAQLIECLSVMRSENPKLFKKPSLIVDGSFLLSKRIVLPRLSKKQCLQYVRDEFADSTKTASELVCDYRKLNASTRENASVFACATEKDQIDSYVQTFKSAGINLASIRIGIESILNCIDIIPSLTKKNFVLNLIDGVTMVSMIFEKGINVFMSRTRLYGEDNEQFIRNILESLSGLIQFNRSEKFDEITHSYYLGLKYADLSLMQEINPYTDVMLDRLNIFKGAVSPRALPANAHFVFLNTLLDDSSIDFIRGRKALDKAKKQQRSKNYLIPIASIVIVAVLAQILYLQYRIAGLNKNIAVINEYLNDEERLAKSNEIDILMKETSYYIGIIDQLNYKQDLDNSRANLTSDIMDLIMFTTAEKVSVSEINFDDSGEFLRVSASSATELDSSTYVDKLKESPFISYIKYAGYDYGSDGTYKFSIDVALAVKEVSN